MPTFSIPQRNADRPLWDDRITSLDLHQRRAELAAQQAKQIARILREHVDVVFDRPTRGALPGDAAKLRGIPVVGARGVGGAIPGTRPGARI